MISLQDALVRLEKDLRELAVNWAQVGGLAVSVRAEPRTTRDIDVAVAVASDREAEQIVQQLAARGYRIGEVLEQTAANRLATVRLTAPGEGGIVVDLLFASSGIEPEVVSAAERLQVLSGVSLPVARLPHLLALKTLAGREQDVIDARALLERASPEDLRLTREALDLIAQRGFDRGKRLQAELDALIARHGSDGSATAFRPAGGKGG